MFFLCSLPCFMFTWWWDSCVSCHTLCGPMYPLSAPLWQLTCPRAHTHHLHNIIRTFSLIRINERSVFRPPESNVRLYNTLQIHVIWCCRRCNNLKRKKSWSGATIWKMICYDNLQIKVTRYNNLQKRRKVVQQPRNVEAGNSRNIKMQKNNAMQKMKIRMSGRN